MKLKNILFVLIFVVLSTASTLAQTFQVIGSNKVAAPYQNKTATTSTETQYYVNIGGKQAGPFSTMQVKNMLEHNEINQSTQVWTQGMADWTPISNVAELNKTYYVNIEGKQAGPFASSQLKNMLSRGEIALSTQVWTQGMAEWTPISNVAELNNANQNNFNNNYSNQSYYNPNGQNTSNGVPLTADESNYFIKKYMSAFYANQQAMQNLFTKQLAGGIVMAALSSCVLLPTGAAFLGTMFVGGGSFFVLAVTFGTMFTVASQIVGPLCAVPFCNAGRVGSIYKKLNGRSLFQKLNQFGIGGGYDWENKTANVMVAIKL